MAIKYDDRWVTIEPLSEGGQAHTFLVRDLEGSGDIKYVLKRLKNPGRLGRFRREVEAIRNLYHAHIVKLIDFNLSAQKPYLVTEFCRGGTLANADPSWYSKPSVAFELFLNICEAVNHAHDNGIIHRDLKPDNIFLRDKSGPIVVGDFGICHLESSDDRLTETHEAVGPRYFMAPELEDGKVESNSPACDVYSLGKVLYWLLTGGETFSREKHRNVRWDLVHKVKHDYLESNIYMEHVNRVLDFMITENVRRRTNMLDIMHSVSRIKKLVELELNPVSSTVEQKCKYCGWGVYKLVAKNSSVYNFGLTPVGNCNWRILVCNECAHVQLFKLDEAKEGTWWERTH